MIDYVLEVHTLENEQNNKYSKKRKNLYTELKY